MRKFLLTILALVVFSATALADTFNPFDHLYKAQAHKEMRKDVAQYNYMVIDENGATIPNAVLSYVNHDNKEMKAQADGNGKVHIEFRQPGFIQLLSISSGGEEYRVLGDDISDEIELKDIRKGDVEYHVIQRHSANRVAYVYDAD